MAIVHWLTPTQIPHKNYSMTSKDETMKHLTVYTCYTSGSYWEDLKCMVTETVCPYLWGASIPFCPDSLQTGSCWSQKDLIHFSSNLACHLASTNWCHWFSSQHQHQQRVCAFHEENPIQVIIARNSVNNYQSDCRKQSTKQNMLRK